MDYFLYTRLLGLFQHYLLQSQVIQRDVIEHCSLNCTRILKTGSEESLKIVFEIIEFPHFGTNFSDTHASDSKHTIHNVWILFSRSPSFSNDELVCESASIFNIVGRSFNCIFIFLHIKVCWQLLISVQLIRCDQNSPAHAQHPGATTICQGAAIINNPARQKPTSKSK